MLIALVAVALMQAEPKLDCNQAGTQDAAVYEVCSGLGDIAAAGRLKPEDPGRLTRFQSAADHYKRVAMMPNSRLKMLALNSLVTLYDGQHLREPALLESTLREIMSVRPDDLTPWLRLSQLQEELGAADAAEQTLLEARQRFSNTPDIYSQLSQFYGRRAAAVGKPPQ